MNGCERNERSIAALFATVSSHAPVGTQKWVKSSGVEADGRAAVAVLLDGALLLQGLDSVHVGDGVAEVELLLADGAEVAGRKVAQ